MDWFSFGESKYFRCNFDTLRTKKRNRLWTSSVFWGCMWHNINFGGRQSSSKSWWQSSMSAALRALMTYLSGLCWALYKMGGISSPSTTNLYGMQSLEKKRVWYCGTYSFKLSLKWMGKSMKLFHIIVSKSSLEKHRWPWPYRLGRKLWELFSEKTTGF